MTNTWDININFPVFDKGQVWLVGAGPGDPGLLTLHAYHALQQADVIVHDALVDQRILALAPQTAQLEQWGKRGGKDSPKQHDITTRLIELARTDQRILRLKGGDPFVFGRGAEEAMGLLEHNIPVRILPGISAGIAGAAYGGIPVTHGAHNQIVSFISAHNAKGDLSDIDWGALAASSPVMVFYMPMKQLSDIRDALLAAGRGANEPVAFVTRATTPDQVVWQTTLAECADTPGNHGIKSPAIMIVGPTVALRQFLATSCGI